MTDGPNDRIGITVTILPETKVIAHQVIERLAAVVTGLAMEGVVCQMAVTPYESEDES